MQRQFINRKEISAFSDLQCKLAYSQEELSEFINKPFSKTAFEGVIAGRTEHFPQQNRDYLVDVIKEQYDDKVTDIQVQLSLLKQRNSFTVTTGHQLNLLTGPLYFIYKIAHTIKLAKELTKLHPNQHFIPVYWMASEDHDFEEINHFNLFGQKVEWNSSQKGPVGLFELENWGKWQADLLSILPNSEKELNEIFAHYKGTDLADATRSLVHFLFKKHGLVIVDGNHPTLKKLFRKTMAKDVMSSFSFEEVEKTNAKLYTAGIKQQVTPRPINLFFIEKGRRERLIPTEGNIVIEGKGEFTPIEMLDLIDNRPELFSPNVVLRPLYQETILPNLAYVGGAGELAYWLQLKGVFDTVEQQFPLLNLRNSFQLVDKNTTEKLVELNLTFKDLSVDVEEIKKSYVLSKSGKELDFSDVEVLVEQLEQSLKFKAEQTDGSLVGMVGGEMARFRKSIESIRGRLIKAEKQKFEQDLNRIEKIKSKLFPNNNLQERYDSFLPYYLKYGDGFIEKLIELSEPFDADLQLVEM